MFRGLERPISRNQRVPQSPQQLPNVELVLSAVHHGGEAEPSCPYANRTILYELLVCKGN